MNFIILSSSRGTTFQSVLDAMANGSLTAQCLGLITDRDDRGCIQKATAADLPVIIVQKNDDQALFEKELDAAIRSLGAIDVIALMGWMWILSPDFITKWKDKIINVHPALLPKYGGEGMYGHHVHNAVLVSGDSESGMTIHTVNDGVDTGKILLQKACPIKNDDTAETLQQRIQELEKEWYPRILQMIETREIEL